MANRNDISALSWGRLLQQTANKVKQQDAVIKQLQENQLTDEVRQAAKDLNADRKAERMRANQMLASFDTTLEELQSLNQSLLTTAQREQLRLNTTAIYASKMQPFVQFDEGALQRLDNWRRSVADSSGQQLGFPEPQPFSQPQSQYEVWAKRQQN